MSHTKRAIVLAIITMLGSSIGIQAQERVRALFVGNSYTYVNDLPGMIADMAASVGDELQHTSSTPGGCTFQQHCTNQSMNYIQQGGWDVVVLQEQSQYPSFPQSQVENEVFPYAAQLVNAIYASSPCAEPMFYMTWGRRDGDQQNAQYFPILGSYEGMDSMLYERYMYMAEANDASVSPVGRVWRKIRREHPEIELYDTDGSHPSMAGTYAAACTFFAMMFHHDPAELTYNGSLAAETARIIRSATSEVVWSAESSMPQSQWMRPYPYSNSIVGNSDTNIWTSDTVQFLNLSTHADSLLWDFGDGMTAISTGDIESIAHSYSDSGAFTVTLIAARHCMYDTTALDIFIHLSDIDTTTPTDTTIIDPVGILDPQQTYNSKAYLFSIFPSVTSGVITVISTSSEPIDVIILSTKGERLKVNQPVNNRQLDLSPLPNGIYLLRLQQNSICETHKIVKI